MNDSTIVYTWAPRSQVRHLAAGSRYTTACGLTIGDEWDSGRVGAEHVPTNRRLCRRCDAAQADAERRAIARRSQSGS